MAIGFHGRGSAGRRRNAEDFRTICSCQLEARKRNGLIARATAFATRASRGAAVVVAIPIALAAFDSPSEVTEMHLRVESASVLPRSVDPEKSGSESLPIFTTAAVRKSFMQPEGRERELTLEVFKEQYFRSEVPYGWIIYREARRNELPPELVAAMIDTESNFRPHLVSKKSAQGLMQIVPETARLLGVANPFDPEENIRAGTRYFRYLLGRFENETMALAAYNAGEGNVSRFRGIPPFAETREYIEKVRMKTSMYRQGIHSSYLASRRELEIRD